MSKKERDNLRSASALSHYLREIGETPLLSGDQERELADKIQRKDDNAARRHLMKANLRLVVSMAKKYSPDRDQDTLLDLIQEGNVGLMKAVDRFKSEFKTRFSTYAVYWIRQAILRALKARRIVRLPENVADQVLKMQRSRQSLYQLLGRVPTTEEIAQEMGIKLTVVRKLEESASEVISLDQAVSGREEDDQTMLKELLEDVEAPAPSQVAQMELVRTAISSAVSSLPEREKEIVELRFGLAGEYPHTLEDIGEKFSISRERVRQLQNTAMARLRQRQGVIQAHQ